MRSRADAVAITSVEPTCVEPMGQASFSLPAMGVADAESRERAFVLFASLWAAATLFHVGSFNQWREHVVLAVAAAWVLCRPGSVAAVATLALLQIERAAAFAPYISNHWLFTSLINAGLLLSVVYLMFRNRRLTVDRAELFATFAPAARMALIVLYFFVVFHKLNADFFDPVVSCGVTFYAAQLSRLPWLPASPVFHVGSIYATIAIEAAIPLMLCFARTRNIGILVGMLFHYVVAMNPISGFYNFSAMLFAMFALFAPQSLLSQPMIGSRAFRMGAVAVAVASGAIAVLVRVLPRTALPQLDLFLVLWDAYGAALIVAFAAHIWRSGKAMSDQRTPRLFAMPARALLVVPIAVFLNGIMPYLGLKTETSWAMFSNLRTEGDRSNHWVIPVSTQVFDFQRDLVQVTSSSDESLQWVAKRHQLIPYFEVRRHPAASVSYLRDGVEARFARVSDDPRFSGEIPLAMRKLLWFRPIDPDEHERCRH
jgi:hypothetical protein